MSTEQPAFVRNPTLSDLALSATFKLASFRISPILCPPWAVKGPDGGLLSHDASMDDIAVRDKVGIHEVAQAH